MGWKASPIPYLLAGLARRTVAGGDKKERPPAARDQSENKEKTIDVYIRCPRWLDIDLAIKVKYVCYKIDLIKCY